MKTVQIGVFGVVMGLLGCSGSQPSASSKTHSTVATAPNAAGPTSPSAAPTLFAFEGSVNVAAQTMTVSYRSPSGELKDEVTLPYGTGGGEVYFHTCTTPAVQYTKVLAGGHLDGMVQAVNNMAGAIPDLAVVMDSVSDSGTTFSTSLGGGNLYGGVPNTGDNTCAANTATWTFTQVTQADFNFKGHATGTAPTGFVLHLDGSGHVTIPGAATLNNENLYTLEGWISEDAPGGGGYQGFISQDNGGCCTIRMLISPSLNPFVNAGAHDDITFSGFTFTVPAWHHWAMTCGSGTATLWVDGANIGTTPCLDPGNISGDSMYLGTGEGGTSYLLTGRIGEVRVSNIVRYSTAFTPQKRFTNDANTMMLLHFDTGSGTTASDSSGHGNNGAFSSATNVTWVADDR